MKAHSLSVHQTARLMECSPRFLRKLTGHRMFPAPDKDGSYDARAVIAARRLHPWMAWLGRPLSERELVAVDPRLYIPAGLGFNQGGRQYARLSSVLDAFWPDK